MTNRKVSIWKYVKTPNGWRYCRAVLGSNNKVRPDLVLYKKQVQEHSEGYYCLNIGGNWIAVGESSIEATKRQKDEQARLAATARGWAIINAPIAAAETIRLLSLEQRHILPYQYSSGRLPNAVAIRHRCNSGRARIRDKVPFTRLPAVPRFGALRSLACGRC